MHREVIGERVARVEPKRRIKRRHDLLGARLRLPVFPPKIPGPEHHPRVARPRADVGIVWMRLPHLAHRVGVGFVKRAALGFRILGKPRAHRPD